MKGLPEYDVMICHPDNKYRTEFVSDRIKTLEGRPAYLPYGCTSGSWGDSGASWTEQYGTPIGVDIVYYTPYEDTFYHLEVDFPLEKMEELVRRAYAVTYVDIVPQPVLQEYITTNKNLEFSGYNQPYNSFSDLIFGFAPQGMVVVWLGYHSIVIELGRFQAKPIKETEALTQWFDDKYAVSREELLEDSYIPDASPKEWDDYRTRYNWKPMLSHGTKDFKLAEYHVWYYNGERETMLQPWIVNPAQRERAIPKEIQFFWQKGKNNQVYEGRVFFDWETTNNAFKNLSSSNYILDIKVTEDNNSIDVLLNGKPLEIENFRIYSSNFEFPVE